MATDKQTEANRINAQSCCGPTSPQGLARSSQNALKSGIYSKAEVTRNESRDEYHDLTAAFHEHFAPATPDEVSFVDALITHEWLSRRYRRADTATWEKRFDQIEEVDVGRVFNERADQFTKAGRLYNASRRGFNSTLKELRQAQALRARKPVESQPEPAVTAAPPTPNATEPRLERAALQSPEPPQTPQSTTPSKPLTPELVSFRNPPPEPPTTDPNQTPTTPEKPEKGEHDPPIAA